METFPIKFLSIVIIIAIALVGAVAALGIFRSAGKKHFLANGNAFSGGIFLGAGILHLLPESFEKLNEIIPSSGIFIAILSILIGILIVFIIEKIVIISKGFEQGASSAFPWVILTALCGHSIIAGLAIGSEIEYASVVVILIAIAVHKGFESFALTVNLLKSGLKASKLKYLVLLFVIMTPIGIIIGSFISLNRGGLAEVISGIFNGIAAGTFIYVSVTDVIYREMILNKQVAQRSLYLIAGILLMAAAGFLLH